MALKLNVVGEVELSEKDLHDAVSSFIQEKYGYPASSVEIRKGTVIARIKHQMSEKGFDRRHAGFYDQNKGAFEEFKRKWNGLYGAIGEIVEAQRKKKKKFISFDDLRVELLKTEDLAGKKMFVKDDEELPMSVIKQRLAPSQLVRQAKRQANLKGVKYDKAGLIL